MPKQIVWIETARRLTLSGRVRVTAFSGDTEFATGLNESDMEPIQRWCEANNCGVRTSFNMIRFRNKKEITMFLLRWGS